MNLHCPLDYIHFDENITLNTVILCMLHYLHILNLSILLQTFYRVYNRFQVPTKVLYATKSTSITLLGENFSQDFIGDIEDIEDRNDTVESPDGQTFLYFRINKQDPFYIFA